MKRFWRWMLVVVLSAAAPAHADDGPVIAAASDLKFALDEIVAEFRKSAGQSVRVSYGSSGNFFRQIAQDAPFELFLSADEELVFRLADQGLTRDRGALYATGRIVLFTARGSPVRPDDRFVEVARPPHPGGGGEVLEQRLPTGVRVHPTRPGWCSSVSGWPKRVRLTKPTGSVLTASATAPSGRTVRTARSLVTREKFMAV